SMTIVIGPSGHHYSCLPTISMEISQNLGIALAAALQRDAQILGSHPMLEFVAMDIHDALRSQYLAALEMLKQPVLLCPDDMWDAPAQHTRVWYVAFHALFFTHLYLQDTEEDFQPRPGLSEAEVESGGRVLSRAEVLDYLGYCQALVNERVPRLRLEAPSGFHWHHFDKLELQIYSIRHIQQHTGELMERVGQRVPIELDWVNVAPDRPPRS